MEIYVRISILNILEYLKGKRMGDNDDNNYEKII